MVTGCPIAARFEARGTRPPKELRGLLDRPLVAARIIANPAGTGGPGAELYYTPGPITPALRALGLPFALLTALGWRVAGSINKRRREGALL